MMDNGNPFEQPKKAVKAENEVLLVNEIKFKVPPALVEDELLILNTMKRIARFFCPNDDHVSCDITGHCWQLDEEGLWHASIAVDDDAPNEIIIHYEYIDSPEIQELIPQFRACLLHLIGFRFYDEMKKSKKD